MKTNDIRVLVVDDDREVAEGTRRVLAQAGYAAVAALSGAEALKAMPVHRPHLVLVDREMPGLDGVELCRRIKGDLAYAEVLVVMISGT